MKAPESARDRIVGAALELIATRGLGGVTMKEVASSANVSRQTLYNHFRDVDSIVVHSLHDHQQAALDELRKMLATIDSPSGRLEHLVRHSGAVGVNHHPIGLLGQALSVQARSSLETYEEELLTIIVDTLQTGVDAAEFRTDIDVTRDARLIRHMMDAVAELTAADPEQAPGTVAAAVRTVKAAVTAAS